MINLDINFNDIRYPLFIGRNILPRIGELLKLYKMGSKYIVIYDENLPAEYFESLANSLHQSELSFESLSIKCGESSKNLNSVDHICTQISQSPKIDTIVGFGGGTMADIAGFASKILTFPNKFIYIPTTVAAQCGSTVTGASYLNVAQRMNAIRINSHPILGWADVDIVQTTTEQDVIAAVGYVLILAVQQKGPLMDFLERYIPEIIHLNKRRLEDLVKLSCKQKLDILKTDKCPVTNYPGVATDIAAAIIHIIGINRLRYDKALLAGLKIEIEISYRSQVMEQSTFDQFQKIFKLLPFSYHINTEQLSAIEHRVLAAISTKRYSLIRESGIFVQPQQIDHAEIKAALTALL